MRGFLTGSLALIVLYVVLKPGSTDKLVSGNNALMVMFRRALSGEVAAIPNKHDYVRSLNPVPKGSGTTTDNSQTKTYTI